MLRCDRIPVMLNLLTTSDRVMSVMILHQIGDLTVDLVK